jgi:nucleoside-diphosphate-sugar epimerase
MNILITGGNGNIAKIIKNHLSVHYNITNLSRNDFNLLCFDNIKTYLNENKFDILIHTAILGGRRTKIENEEIVYKNLIMFENLIYFADKFKMIINFDSAATYDRSTDILNRKENELNTIPTDYYGFSKYIIFKRLHQYNNAYNLRLFNVFHINDEPDRFVKSCFLSKINNKNITIIDDKYFDFIYEDDFIKILNFYFDNINNQTLLHKTINVCYDKKYKLSDIANIIIGNKSKFTILNNNNMNYSGDNSLLKSYNINFIGLEDSLKKYEEIFIKKVFNYTQNI